MKFILLALPFILVGCSSAPIVEESLTKDIDAVAVEAPTQTILPEQPLKVEIASAPKVSAAKETIVYDVAPSIAPEEKPISVESSGQIYDKIKSAIVTVKKIKKTVDEVKEIWEEKDPEPIPAPLPANSPLPDMAPPPDYRVGTGAKVSLFGVGMEFWLGNNDSWSTVLKLLVLLLVTYGGFKAINYFFDRKNNQQLKTV